MKNTDSNKVHQTGKGRKWAYDTEASENQANNIIVLYISRVHTLESWNYLDIN